MVCYCCEWKNTSLPLTRKRLNTTPHSLVVINVCLLFIMMYRTSRKFCKSPFPTKFLAGSSLAARSFSTVVRQNDRFKLPNGIKNNGSSEFEGTLARTDSTVQVEHPSESDLPTSEPVKGRGGFHHKRTLPSFSLEGKVGVVTVV